MARNPGDKIQEGLSTMLQGFSELEDMLEADFSGETESEEYTASVVAEVLSAIESLIDSEDYTPRYIASVVTALTDALEEVDPDLFNAEKEAEEAEEDDDDDDDDDDDEEDEDEDDDEDFEDN